MSTTAIVLSALAVAGRIGLTAIGDTLEEARTLYYDVKRTLDEAVADHRLLERRNHQTGRRP